jgi:anthranilate phosphoribosyltransferase
VPVRRELGIRTVFNLLGPLSNPAGARRQLLGVFEPRWCAAFARVLALLGSERALVVCGCGPGGQGHLDEVSTWGPTTVARLENGSVTMERFDPASVGIPPPRAEALAVEGPEDSARVIRAVLRGEPGPARDVVLVNAAAAAQAGGVAAFWPDGMALAARALDEGRVAAVLEKLAALSNDAGA